MDGARASRGEPGGVTQRLMAQHEIHGLVESDLPELGEFLIKGFHAPLDATFAAVDVLRWKYLDPRGAEAGDLPRSYLAKDRETGRIVGHVGICPGRFHGGGLPAEGVSTLHMIDWLASEEGKGAGGLLMRRAHRSSDTQFGFGGSAAGRGVIDRGGYALVAKVPVYHRVLRPSYRLRDPAHRFGGRALRAAKDVLGMLRRSPIQSRTRIEIRRVEKFGDEILSILQAYESRAVFTTREPGLLNSFLGYPGGGVSGWHLLRDGILRGFAILSIVPGPGGVKAGKIAECLLVDGDDTWHAAMLSLTDELKTRKADIAVAFAANEWTVRALESSGYIRVHGLEFRLRDRSKKMPAGAAFHLTPLEADYAYT